MKIYITAQSDMNKAKVRLTIEMSDFDHLKENLKKKQTEARLKLIKQLTKLEENGRSIGRNQQI